MILSGKPCPTQPFHEDSMELKLAGLSTTAKSGRD